MGTKRTILRYRLHHGIAAPDLVFNERTIHGGHHYKTMRCQRKGQRLRLVHPWGAVAVRVAVTELSKLVYSTAWPQDIRRARKHERCKGLGTGRMQASRA